MDEDLPHEALATQARSSVRSQPNSRASSVAGSVPAEPTGSTDSHGEMGNEQDGNNNANTATESTSFEAAAEAYSADMRPRGLWEAEAATARRTSFAESDTTLVERRDSQDSTRTLVPETPIRPQLRHRPPLGEGRCSYRPSAEAPNSQRAAPHPSTRSQANEPDSAAALGDRGAHGLAQRLTGLRLRPSERPGIRDGAGGSGGGQQTGEEMQVDEPSHRQSGGEGPSLTDPLREDHVDDPSFEG